MALELIRGLQPNVAIVDINMPGMDGIETTRRIKEEFSSVAVLILTAYDYERYVLACLEAGADGYVLKGKMPSDRLTDAVRMVHIGMGTFDLNSVVPIMRLVAASQPSPIKRYKLSNREREVLSLAATGIPSKQIAATLNISELTVNSYFTSIFKKLGVQSRIEAVMLAIKEGLITNVYAANKES
jgi:DNA-binding NarL/FixJ family response regulator